MVLARSGSAWTAATSLLNAHVAALEVKSMECFDGSLGMFGEDEFDKSKSAGVARVRIAHDGCILDFTIFAKDFSEVFLLDLLSEASDEKVGAFVVLIATRLRLSVAWSVLVSCHVL
jgi:hypothetical protein